MKPNTIILSRHNNPDAHQAALEEGVLKWCRSRGVRCSVVPHLYHLPETSDVFKKLGERLENALLLCWIFPRPAACLLKRHHLDVAEEAVVHLGEFSDVEEVLALLAERINMASGGKKTSVGKKTPVESIDDSIIPRWYPIMDLARCVQCGHCLQFCLFGVYETDTTGRVIIKNPDQCKNGCPACSRVCPQSAIMFALYDKDDAIAGAPGQFVTIDAAARKMFYTRTQTTCPACGRRPSKKPLPETGSICPECGFPVPTENKSDAKSEAASDSTSKEQEKAPFDDLDLLVDQLDHKMQRRTGRK